MKASRSSLIKRHRFGDFPYSIVLSRERQRAIVANTAYIHIQPLGIPLISAANGSSSESILLEQFRSYSVGRSHRRSDFVFLDPRVSKQHCQILFDAVNRKIWIGDGMCWSGSNGSSRVRVSLNGLFVNGVRIARGEAVELCAGNEVSLVCGNEGACGSGTRIGFVVQRIDYIAEVVDKDLHKFGAGRSFISDLDSSKYGGIVKRANFLLCQCRQVLHSNDPVSCIQKCVRASEYDYSRKNNGFLGFIPSNVVECPMGLDASGAWEKPLSVRGSHEDQRLENINASTRQVNMVSKHLEDGHFQNADYLGAKAASGVTENGHKDLHSSPVIRENAPQPYVVVCDKSQEDPIPPPGSKFYLNRLQGVSQGLSDHHVIVSLPELLRPVESLSQIFIATFTCDIIW